MRKAIIFIVMALLLLCGAPVYAQPALPNAFYGTVEINGSSAPAGTTISASVDGVKANTIQNPVRTTRVGSYGIDSLKLLVQGDIIDGAIITFLVNGHVATTDPATVEWHSRETARVNLSVTIAAPSPPSVGAVGPTTYYAETTFFGIEGRFRIDSTGKILETITATSADGNLTITIPKGTIALDKDGNPLESLEASIDESPPDPPENCCIIGLAFDFGPEGATFDPGITFEYTYDPAELPGGVAEADLVIAFYDAEAGEWVTCDCTCDPEANCITACVCHFTTFAIIGAAKPAAFTLSSLVISPAEVGPDEKVNISISVANTGGMEGSYAVVLKINGVKEAEKRVTIVAGSSQLVSFSVTREDAGSYIVTVDGISDSFVVVVPAIAPPPPAPPPPAPPAPPAPAPPAPVPAPVPPVPPPPPAPNWPLIGGIIAAVVVVGLLIYFLVVRRRAY